jgi:hypothetical protein
MAAKHLIVGGAGETITLEHVYNVVAGGPSLEVVIDSSAADRVKKESPPPKSFEPEAAPASAGAQHVHGASLDEAQTRALLFFKLLALCKGKSKVRLTVLESLTSLLNSGADVLPALPAGDEDQAALARLADAMHGFGTVRSDSQPLAAALEAAGLTTPGLSAAERAVLQDGQSASAGTAAVCVSAGRMLLSAATAVAALSAEALGADVSSPLGSWCRPPPALLAAASRAASHGSWPSARPRPCTMPTPTCIGAFYGGRGGRGAATQGRVRGRVRGARGARRLAAGQRQEGRSRSAVGSGRRRAGKSGGESWAGRGHTVKFASCCCHGAARRCCWGDDMVVHSCRLLRRAADPRKGGPAEDTDLALTATARALPARLPLPCRCTVPCWRR